MHRTMSLLLSTSIITGCAGSLSEQQALDCPAIHQVVASASEDFESLSGPRNVTRYGDVRNVKVHAYGDCSVFSTAGSPARYLCSKESSAQLDDRAELIETVQSCLGTGWGRSELPGGGALFERAGVQVSVGKTDPQASGDSGVGLIIQRGQRTTGN